MEKYSVVISISLSICLTILMRFFRLLSFKKYFQFDYLLHFNWKTFAHSVNNNKKTPNAHEKLIILLFLFQNFREQCIDGDGLPLLTEDHLMHSLNMKLGPALKLRSVLLKKLGGPCPCVSCCNPLNNSTTVTAVNSVPSPLNSGRPSSTGSGT